MTQSGEFTFGTHSVAVNNPNLLENGRIGKTRCALRQTAREHPNDFFVVLWAGSRPDAASARASFERSDAPAGAISGALRRRVAI